MKAHPPTCCLSPAPPSGPFVRRAPLRLHPAARLSPGRISLLIYMTVRVEKTVALWRGVGTISIGRGIMFHCPVDDILSLIWRNMLHHLALDRSPQGCPIRTGPMISRPPLPSPTSPRLVLRRPAHLEGSLRCSATLDMDLRRPTRCVSTARHMYCKYDERTKV